MPRLIPAVLLGLVTLLFVAPSTARACQSDAPTFGQAVHGARAIALITIVEGADPDADDPTHSETYRIDRVLKGSLPKVITVAPAWTTLCHDSVGSWVGPKGSRAIVAFDVPFYDQAIHPVWTRDASGRVSGSAGLPSGLSTLRELAAEIEAELLAPDTSTPTPATPDRLPVPMLLFIGLAFAVATAAMTVRRSIRARR